MKLYKTLKEKRILLSNIIWSVGGQTGTIVLNFITNVVMTRFLAPNEFGQISLLLLIVSLAMVVCDFGLSGALIGKADIQESDYATVLFVNVSLSVIIFIALLIFAPYASLYYSGNNIVLLFSAAGTIIILQSFYLSINARLIRELEFKKRSLERLISGALSSVLSILHAIMVGGIWSLMLFHILNSLFLVLSGILNKEIKIRLYYKKSAFKSLYSFGINTTLSSLMHVGFESIYQFLIAKYLHINQVGYYYQAKKIQEMPYNLMNMLTQNVFFASLAQVQENPSEFKELYTRLYKKTVFIIAFISATIYIYADLIIEFIYGKKWNGAVYYLKILTTASFFLYLDYVIRLIFKVYNKTAIILGIEIVKKTIQFLLILCTIYYRKVEWIILTIVIGNIFGVVMNLFYSTKVVRRDFLYEIKYLLKIIGFSLMIGLLFNPLAEAFGPEVKTTKLLLLPTVLSAYLLYLRKAKIWN